MESKDLDNSSAGILCLQNSRPQFVFETVECNLSTEFCVKTEHISPAFTVMPEHVVRATGEYIHEILLFITGMWPSDTLLAQGDLKIFLNTEQTIIRRVNMNPLQTKRRLLYLKNQSVPRSKHFSSRL